MLKKYIATYSRRTLAPISIKRFNTTVTNNNYLLQVERDSMNYDVLIIGGGPAGN